MIVATISKRDYEILPSRMICAPSMRFSGQEGNSLGEGGRGWHLSVFNKLIRLCGTQLRMPTGP